MRYDVIFRKNYKTKTGQKRLVEVEDLGWRGYEVCVWSIPKKKNSTRTCRHLSLFDSKSKAIKKARALAK